MPQHQQVAFKTSATAAAPGSSAGGAKGVVDEGGKAPAATAPAASAAAKDNAAMRKPTAPAASG